MAKVGQSKFPRFNQPKVSGKTVATKGTTNGRLKGPVVGPAMKNNPIQGARTLS